MTPIFVGHLILTYVTNAFIGVTNKQIEQTYKQILKKNQMFHNNIIVLNCLRVAAINMNAVSRRHEFRQKLK